jgi:8-amino-3,8-dideoxy-alpha-D-manno-octulosonate transaminase
MLGNPARLSELDAIAQKHRLWLIEDCAQAFGASYCGRPVGSIGIAGALSFNIFKTITCGDGGMLITSDTDLYQRAFALHDQGHLPLRKGVEMGRRPLLGLNFRMTELSGAVLVAQLGKLGRIRGHLRAQKALFKSRISDLPGLEFRDLPDRGLPPSSMRRSSRALPRTAITRRWRTSSQHHCTGSGHSMRNEGMTYMTPPATAGMDG